MLSATNNFFFSKPYTTEQFNKNQNYNRIWCNLINWTQLKTFSKFETKMFDNQVILPPRSLKTAPN